MLTQKLPDQKTKMHFQKNNISQSKILTYLRSEYPAGYTINALTAVFDLSRVYMHTLVHRLEELDFVYMREDIYYHGYGKTRRLFYYNQEYFDFFHSVIQTDRPVLDRVYEVFQQHPGIYLRPTDIIISLNMRNSMVNGALHTLVKIHLVFKVSTEDRWPKYLLKEY